ncbi:efflux RND transporter periplasmic adaptor subunit [Acidimangrovimonas pyrenivorans]|uniref:Efflux RND transporter periplasmic adaptor subunit n=1 Tax=Acidimangrovimonas pyrenivorans TaxID=2030798 RepID=A0ABV7ALA1_9RHOB
MPARFRAHRVAALLVLIGAGAWVATGKFSAVGSEEAQAAQPAEKAPTAVEAPTLPTVAVVAPHFADHSRKITISGATAADKMSVLAARTSGVIHALNVEKGDAVKQNDVVMTLEGPELKANVATAEALVAQRDRELKVAESLYRSGNTSELKLTSARSAKAAADSQLSQAQAAADRLELRAPFAGVIEAVDVEQGEWVQPGTKVATLLALDPIVVDAEVSETDIKFIQTGAKARVRLVDGRSFEGTVRFVSKEANSQTRTFPVEVALPNPDDAIPAGMTAEVTLYTPAVKSVTVPRSIITLSEDGTLGLRVVDDRNVAHFAPVTLIDDTPDGLVLAGVPDGVQIVVSGQDLVKDGETVQPVPAPKGALE